MCELFAMSSFKPTEASFSLDEFSKHGGLTDRHKDGWGIAYYDDNDARIIKETYVRAKAARDYATLIKLRKKILEVIDVKDYNGNDMQFIDTILKDYNYYTQAM